ncbi:MAG: ATP-binding protein [Pseudomonadota bacterium]
MKGTQLALAVALGERQDFEHFHPGPNAEVVATLRVLLDVEDGSSLLLHGPSGSGKTHLVQALLKEAGECGLRATLLDVHRFNTPTRALETVALLCIDGLDATPLEETQALALIRLLDARRQRAVATLATARKPAAQLMLPRPDLLTRLSGFSSFGLRPLSDDDRIGLLRLRASTRGLNLSLEVASYLLKHLPRDVASLLAAVDTLDQASLAAKRGLTIPLVQETLGLGG